MLSLFRVHCIQMTPITIVRALCLFAFRLYWISSVQCFTNRACFTTGFEPLATVWGGRWKQCFENFFSAVRPSTTAKKSIHNHEKYWRFATGCASFKRIYLNALTDIETRRKFILKLAKALLTFGAPSHRIESQLLAASNILDARAGENLIKCFNCPPLTPFCCRICPSSEYNHSICSKWGNTFNSDVFYTIQRAYCLDFSA